MITTRSWLLVTLLVVLAGIASPLAAQQKRKVIIDQDAAGPASTDLQSVLVFIQSPQTEVLGITIVSGDLWRDEEVAHTLRMLELIGRTDIPVVPGAVFPLVNSKEFQERWETLYGKTIYQGVWKDWRTPDMPVRGPWEIPPLPEGSPTTKPADEDAAHFIIRMVHKYPHQVTIYAGGPHTNLALAIRIDPQVPELAQELVFMGGSISEVLKTEGPQTQRREFNLWWDPEAVHIVLTAPWHKITDTTVDTSVKTNLTKAMIAEIAKSPNRVAQYIAKYATEGYMWDELAAAEWLDPSIITSESQWYMDIDCAHEGGYGNILIWDPGQQPGLGEQIVHVPMEINVEKFYKMFIDLMMRPTPGVRATQ